MPESIYVVMTNDFPDCVFSEEWKAEIYCDEQKKWQKGKLKDYQLGSAIYYRVYSFELDRPGMLLSRRNEHYNSENPTNIEQENFRASLRAAWEERQRIAGHRPDSDASAF